MRIFPPNRSLPLQAAALAALLAVSSPPVMSEGEAQVVGTVRLADVTAAADYSAPATVVARYAPRIATEIDARVSTVPVEVGDRVAPGDVVATLDCERAQATLAIARAELERASAQRRFAATQLERARDLTRSKSISDEVRDQRRSELAAAEADQTVRDRQVRLAELDVDHCVIRSPIAGAVTGRYVSVGDYAVRGSAVVDLVETEGQEVSAALRDDQVRSLQRAEQRAFTSNGDRREVALRALLPQVDPATRTREARLRFTTARGGPDPGTAGRLVWQGHEVLVPATYLVRRGQALGVFVLDQGSARFVALPDAQDGRPAVVDLDPQTRLIDEGRQRLNDGDAVRTSPSQE